MGGKSEITDNEVVVAVRTGGGSAAADCDFQHETETGKASIITSSPRQNGDVTCAPSA